MTKLPLPNPSFFTLQELSQHWGCDRRLVENYVFDQRLLRPGFRVRDLGEHVDCSFFVASIDRIRFGDLRFLVDGDLLARDQWVYLWIKGPLPYDAYRVRGVDMVLCYGVGETDALENSHCCLELEFQDFEGNSLKLVPRGDTLIYGTELCDCGADAVVLSPKHEAEVIIPREEVERFEQANLNAKHNLTFTERDVLLATIGMLAKQVISDHKTECAKGTDNKNPNVAGIVRLLSNHLPDDSKGLGTRSLGDYISEGLALLRARSSS